MERDTRPNQGCQRTLHRLLGESVRQLMIGPCDSGLVQIADRGIDLVLVILVQSGPPSWANFLDEFGPTQMTPER
jgi:hypothetical protein